MPEIPGGQGQGQQQAPPGTIMISQADEQAINRVFLFEFSSCSLASLKFRSLKLTLPATKTKNWLQTSSSTDWPTEISRWLLRALLQAREVQEVQAREGKVVLSLQKMKMTTICSTDLARILIKINE